MMLFYNQSKQIARKQNFYKIELRVRDNYNRKNCYSQLLFQK